MKPRLLLLLGAVAVISAALAAAAADAPEAPRGGRVGWARLRTSSAHWNRHSPFDHTLSEFIRAQTSLNMDPEWQSADPADLKQLCGFPLIFTNSLLDVREPADRDHLREYVRRGGFLVIDACTNPSVTRDPDAFLKEHTALATGLIAGAEVRMLPADHAIYRAFFPMRETPPHSFMSQTYDPKWAKHGLYGVFDGDRMFALVSLSGLQCGWAQTMQPGHDVESMKMLVNIYVYAMTR